eukprot:5634921-Ditylum_brightwellii.AAC.2
MPDREKLWDQHIDRLYSTSSQNTTSIAPSVRLDSEPETGWTWELPPLNQNGKWFQARKAKLWEVLAGLEDRA